MSTVPKDCCERTDQVAEYALRAMPAGERAAFDQHIAGCPDCQQELAEVRPTVNALVDWPTDILKPPVPLWGRLADRIVADSGGEPLPEPEAERRVGAPGWREVAPGISCKLLSTDAANQRVSMLVRLAPGTAYPSHRHSDVEELHLLDGELWIDDRKLDPGDYTRAEPATEDSWVWSETGCTCVLVTSLRDILH